MINAHDIGLHGGGGGKKAKNIIQMITLSFLYVCCPQCHTKIGSEDIIDLPRLISWLFPQIRLLY